MLTNSSIANQTQKANDLMDEQGNWNMNMLRQLLLQGILDIIKSIDPPYINQGKDICLWKGTRHGSFSVANALII